uniref:hypothetical protein n=1 Tax=Alistipes putredinis TaxID=28117 RepID=UPI003FD7A0BC
PCCFGAGPHTPCRQSGLSLLETIQSAPRDAQNDADTPIGQRFRAGEPITGKNGLSPGKYSRSAKSGELRAVRQQRDRSHRFRPPQPTERPLLRKADRPPDSSSDLRRDRNAWGNTN